MSLDLNQQLHFNHNPGPDHVPDQPGQRAPADPLVRLLAFYLPQFHAIPENDEWWGKGFTEWTNVTKATPRFAGHYQPRLPADLGFYDLGNPDTLRAQADLARRHGVSGFCFYDYWFAGKRLLNKPIDTLLANTDIDLPFCICWANENWTRRWDGADDDLLIGQQHSPEDDLAYAEQLEKYFSDERYITVGGRPLMLVYRPSLLPDAKATVERWRAYFLERGFSNPYFALVHAYDHEDPTISGFDAAVGFPPRSRNSPPLLEGNLTLFDHRYCGARVKYEDLIRSLQQSPEPNFCFHPTVLIDWDNDARKPNKGFTLVGSTPRKYGNWLASACQTALQKPDREERLVFINAWNEWAEGTYLEPDRHYGFAYIAETARVLNQLTDPNVLAARIAEFNVYTSDLRVERGSPARTVGRAKRLLARGAETLAKLLRET